MLVFRRRAQQVGAETLESVICNVLRQRDLTLEWEYSQRAAKDTHKLHELQNIEAHPNGFCDRSSVSTIHTGLSSPNHGLDVMISHRGTMAFEGFPENLEETRGLPNVVVDLLLDQFRVQYRPDIISLGCHFVGSELE